METVVLELLRNLSGKPVHVSLTESRLIEMLHTDASTDGLGAVRNQGQLDKSVRPIPYINRATLPS